jgi:gas vesicle protein
MTEKSNSQVMGATLLGGLVGASLAMLFAPKSGRETRQQIHEGINHAQDEASAKIDELKARLRDQLNESEKDKRKKPIMSAWEEEV